MADSSIDRNLLFGVLALQDDLITQGQFADVCAGWAVRMQTPLSDLLIERKWLTPADRDGIEERLKRKLAKHGGDVRATLGAVAGAEVRDVIRQVEAPAVRQSLNMLPPAPSFVRVETLAPLMEHRSRYTLSRLHAEGGLGKVWVARDTDLNRDVALKEIRADRIIHPEASRRFLKEAQVTGQLEHPNIVPVYELSRRPEDDQPFYTMRFVRGRTLRDAIADHHQRRGAGPADPLERQKLLTAFVAICQAMGYAHSRGVIHRDLKPENIVLGAFGEVIVLDWGLAKLVDRPDEDTTEVLKVALSDAASTVATIGQVGTPSYMAPEQADGRHDLVDSRTDVYGLGAILFEVLTGRPPVEGDTVAEVLQRVVSRETLHPRAVLASVPKALDAICYKAIAKSRADRYPSAVELAEEVQRWIADEPVSAYRDPLPARLLRWGRRHKTLVVGLAALLLTAVVGLAAVVVFVNRERAKTEQQRRLAVANAQQALHNLRLAQNAADGLLAEVADVDLADIPQMETVRKRLLEKARTGYQQFLAQEGDDPLIRWGSGRSLVRLGDIQALLGDVSAAEASYNQAIALLEALVKHDPDNADYRRDLARGDQGFGVLLKDANRYESAESWLRKALELRTKLAEGPDASAEDRQALADSQYQLGALLARRGAKRSEDADAYRAALAVQEALAQQYVDRPEYRSRLARYRNNYAMLQRASGQVAEAEATYRATLALLAPALAGPDALPGPRWQSARAVGNLGAVLLEKKDKEEAATQLRRARDLLQTLTSEFPAVPQYQQELALISYNLGLLSQRSGDLKEAVASYREMERLFEALHRQFPKTPLFRQKLALAHVAVADALAPSAPADAETTLRSALEEQAGLLVEFPDVHEYQAEMGRSHFQLARHLLVLKKPAEAVRATEQAAALYRKVLQARPTSDVVQRQLMENEVVRALGLIDAGRLSDARTTAEQLPAIRTADADASSHAAVLLLRCAEAYSATPDGQRLADDCRASAVQVLRAAVRSNLIRSQAELDNPVFRPLHEREDFQKLRKALAPPVPG